MAGWEQTPKGWEDTNGKYSILSKQNINIKNIENVDMVIIMAGGLDKDGNIHPWVKNRLDIALSMYKNNPVKLLCSGGGTYHKPPCLNKDGFVIHEATACSEYLIKNGVHANNIFKEWGSYDTIASVYYSLLLHVIPSLSKRIVIITSEFHMERTKLLFEWLNELLSLHLNYIFISSKDEEYEEIIKRREREKESVTSLLLLKNKLKTSKDFYLWMYTKHKAYSCNDQHYKENIPDDIKRSY